MMKNPNEPNHHTMIMKPNQIDRNSSLSPRQRNSDVFIEHLHWVVKLINYTDTIKLIYIIFFYL